MTLLVYILGCITVILFIRNSEFFSDIPLFLAIIMTAISWLGFALLIFIRIYWQVETKGSTVMNKIIRILEKLYKLEES